MSQTASIDATTTRVDEPQSDLVIDVRVNPQSYYSGPERRVEQVPSAVERRARFSTRILDAGEFWAIADEWEALRVAQPRPEFEQRLDYLIRTYDQVKGQQLRAAALYDGMTLVGVAPIALKHTTLDWSMRTHRVRHKVLRFPIIEAKFPGSYLIAPPSAEAQAKLLEGLLAAAHGAHVVLFSWVDTTSLMWDLLQRSDVSHSWRRWTPTEPIVRPLVRLAASHEDYMSENFNRKARYNLRREDRLLDEATGGSLRLEIITDADQVTGFLDDCEVVQEASGQLEHGAKPISNRSGYPRRLTWYANNGWLRSYVLRCDDGPIAILLAYARDNVLLASTPAYAQQWAKYSPGKVMWTRIIADLHEQPHVGILDFGHGDYPYKRHFANDSIEMGRVNLVRRSPRATISASGPMLYWSARRMLLHLLSNTDGGKRARSWARRHFIR